MDELSRFSRFIESYSGKSPTRGPCLCDFRGKTCRKKQTISTSTTPRQPGSRGDWGTLDEKPRSKKSSRERNAQPYSLFLTFNHHVYSPAQLVTCFIHHQRPSGQAVVAGVFPLPPRYLPSCFFIAHRVQQFPLFSFLCSLLFLECCQLTLSLARFPLVHFYARNSLANSRSRTFRSFANSRSRTFRPSTVMQEKSSYEHEHTCTR